MNITNLEIAQASMELFGSIVCVLAILTINMNKSKKKSLQIMKRIFACVVVLLVSESTAYITRGNLQSICVILNYAGNFINFAFNLVLSCLLVRYTKSIIEENGGTTSKWFVRIVDAIFVVVMGILISNIFTGWMYVIDENNYYHRAFGWNIYIALSAISIMFSVIQSLASRKIGKRSFITILIYIFVPYVCMYLTFMFYGISFVNFGIAISVIGLFLAYLKDWSEEDEPDTEVITNRKRYYDTILLLFIITLTMSASIITCIVSIYRMSSSNAEKESVFIASVVQDSIENTIMKPVVVAETMAQDYTLKELIMRSKEDPYAVETDMSTYMESIKSGFDYNMVYVVCEDSKAYYTSKGIAKFVDLENDPHDVWYKDFIATDKLYELNIDTDETNQWELSVFVNMRVTDESGNLLGVCGVGVKVTELQELLEKFETQYGLKINTVNSNGLVLLSRDIESVERETIDSTYFSKVGSDNYYIEKIGDLRRMTIYMEYLDCYLVVRETSPDAMPIGSIVAPSVVIFLVGILILGMMFISMSMREQRHAEELAKKNKAAVTDKLTGLLNRRGFDEEIAKIVSENKVSECVIVMMDVNGLKTVNDNLGHNAGDELIIGAANCMTQVLGEHGKIFRLGGDEFEAILRCSEETIGDALKTFDHVVSSWKGALVPELSISKGYVICSKYPELPMEELLEMADKEMYADKEQYYIRTGKKRRT